MDNGLPVNGIFTIKQSLQLQADPLNILLFLPEWVWIDQNGWQSAESCEFPLLLLIMVGSDDQLVDADAVIAFVKG